MIRACLFDLDGTLLYTLTSLAFSGNEALKAFGYSPEPEEAYRYYCGEGAHVLVERIMKKNNDTDPEHIEEAFKIQKTALLQKASLGVHPYEGMTETLKELKKRGIKIAVCTNKPHDAAVSVIEDSFGKGFFDCIVGQRDPLRRKPYPDEALYVCKTLQVLPEECLYFGDSGTDMKTAKAAAMKGYGVLWGYRTENELLENGAEGLISNPMEILDLCDKC